MPTFTSYTDSARAGGDQNGEKDFCEAFSDDENAIRRHVEGVLDNEDVYSDSNVVAAAVVSSAPNNRKPRDERNSLPSDERSCS